MLGAALLLSALALLGGSDDVQVSPVAPHAGRAYAAVRYTGSGELECSGAVGKTFVRVRYERTEAGTTCLLLIPKGTVGKRLVFGFSLRVQEPFVCDGSICRTSIGHSDSVPIRRLIRR